MQAAEAMLASAVARKGPEARVPRFIDPWQVVPGYQGVRKYDEDTRDAQVKEQEEKALHDARAGF